MPALIPIRFGSSPEAAPLRPLVRGVIPVAPPLIPAAFDPLTVHNGVLSNADLTFTGSSGSADQGCRTVTGQSSGKYCFSTDYAPAGSFREGFGIVTAATPYATFSNHGVNGVWWDSQSTNIFSNGVLMFTTGATASPGFVMWAVNMDDLLLWVRNPGGNWNGQPTGNPATLMHGVPIPAGAMLPTATFGGFGGSPGRTVTANFGATALPEAPPLGYVEGWPA